MYGLSDSDTKTAAAQKEIRLKGNEQGPPAVLDKDSSGFLEISFRIDTLSPHSEVCIGAVPDLGSAEKVLYEVRAAHGKNLYMGIRMPKMEISSYGAAIRKEDPRYIMKARTAYIIVRTTAEIIIFM